MGADWFKNEAHDPVLAMGNEGKLMDILKQVSLISKTDILRSFLSLHIASSMPLLE